MTEIVGSLFFFNSLRPIGCVKVLQEVGKGIQLFFFKKSVNRVVSIGIFTQVNLWNEKRKLTEIFIEAYACE